jgi:tetratricopeptide (TPR) repeat protein
VDLYVTQATILRYRGRTEESRHALHTARDHAVGAERARVEHNIARSLNHDGEFEEAATTAQLSLDLTREHGARVLLPYALEVLATAYIGLKRTEAALPLLAEALDAAQADCDRRATCQVLNQSGNAQMLLQDWAAAHDLLNRGYVIARAMGYPLWMKSFSQSLAQVHEARGDFQSATEAYKDVVRLQNAMRD